MIYTELTLKAINSAYKAHEGVMDNSGIPYIFHPFLVAEQMEDEISTAVAMLHDVIEDTPVTLDDLRKEGFPEEVIEAVDLLTKRDDEEYGAYIRRLKDSGNQTALAVKRADLAHNSDESRLRAAFPPSPELEANLQKRRDKYDLARSILEEEN